MFDNSQFDSVRKMFADQFSRETHGYVYRKGQKGAPTPLSEAERDEFVNNFNKYLRVAIWSLIPATVGMILLLAWLVREPDSPTGQMAMWGAIVAIIAPYMAIFYWAWYAPARELKHRTPTGNELTKAEARTLALSKISYGQLILGVAMVLVVVWKASAKTDVFHGWGRLWLVFAGGLIIVAGLQAIRKWRYGGR